MLGYFDDIYIIKDYIITHFISMLLCLYHKNEIALKSMCSDKLYNIFAP